MDAASTASTMSSSGIPDGDIALLGHPDDSDYVCAIERNLNLLGYSVVQSQIAGRGIISNMISGVHHASLTSVIVLTDESCKEFHKFCEPLNQPRFLLKDLYLIIYESDKSRPSTSDYRGGYHMKAGCSAEETAEQIAYFAEACKEIGMEDIETTERRAFCASLLISYIVNPDSDSRMASKPMDKVKLLYESRFGSFNDLNLGQFNTFIETNDYICVAKDNVAKLTRKGAIIHQSWTKRVNDILFSKKEIATRQEQNKKWLSDQLSSSTAVNGDSMNTVLKMFDKVDGSQAYFLITTCVPENKLDGISEIPWIQVYDFDCQDADDGLFGSLDFKQRKVSRATLGDDVQPLDPRQTNWLTISDNDITDFSEWEDKYDSALKKAVIKAAEYCCPDKSACFVVLWYETDSKVCYILDRFLQRIRKYFAIENLKTFPVKVIFCGPELPTRQSEIFHTVSRYKLDPGCIKISTCEISQCFKKVGSTMKNASMYGIVTVPGKTLNGELKSIEIKTKDFPSYIYILPTEMQTTEEVSEEIIHKTKQESFHKGDLATWDHIARGTVAIKRDLENEICEKLKKEIGKRWKPTVFKLFHAPGSGGSTLARQIMWSLRKVTTCVEVKPPYPSVVELVKYLRILHEMARLPLLILLDGNNENNIVSQAKLNIDLVVLHVERKQPDSSERSVSDTISLKDFTSSVEASNLIKILTEFVPNRAELLVKLQRRADEKYDPPQMFEFGLCAFNEYYVGIKNYVSGFFNKKDPLLRWQRILVYLSILDFYGQSGINRNVFKILLHPYETSFVKKTDLPYRAYQFFVENEQEWRISYPRVAREILQLALAPFSEYNDSRVEPINAPFSKFVRNCLHTYVIQLINTIKQVTGKKIHTRFEDIIFGLIFRRETTSEDKTKERFSRLLNDIADDNKKLNVMVSLINLFPENTRFNAHAGRVCSLLGNFQKAESYLSKALKLQKHKSGITDCMETSRIHNMFADSCSRQVRQLLRENKVNIEKSLDEANKSIFHFAQSRQIRNENHSYGYMGEIRLRIFFAEYVNQQLGGCSTAFDRQLDDRFPRLAEFIRNSNAICGDLLEECKLKSKERELSKSKYHEALLSYNVYFKDAKVEYSEMEDIHLHVPLVRNHLRNVRRALEGNGTVGYIDTNQTIREITAIYEKLLSAIFAKNVSVPVNLDMYNWLLYIRHPALSDKLYNLDEVVLSFVTDWSRRSAQDLADFYLYAIKFAIAFSSDKPKSDDVVQLEELRRKLRSPLFPQGKRLEFLTNRKKATIKKLIQRLTLGEWDHERKTWKNEKAVRRLQVCTGTIQNGCQSLFGLISLDLANLDTNQKILIYFNPKRYQMQGKSGCRVEFHVAFDTFNAAEANCVRLIEKVKCPSCHRKSEKLTLNQHKASFKCRHCLKVIS